MELEHTSYILYLKWWQSTHLEIVKQKRMYDLTLEFCTIEYNRFNHSILIPHFLLCLIHLNHESHMISDKCVEPIYK